MHLIYYEIVAKFKKKHAAGRSAFDGWTTLATASNWKNYEDLKKTFPSADTYGDCTIFNVGGNKYRLIALVDYETQTIYIKQVLTHAEYDRDRWKRFC